MLVCFLLALLAPAAIASVCSLLARRALPLLSGGFTVWLAASAAMGWVAVCAVGLVTVVTTAYVLDGLVERCGIRRVVIAAEATAGAVLCAMPAHALLSSFGVQGTGLWSACVVIACMAAGTSLAFRTGEEEFHRV